MMQFASPICVALDVADEQRLKDIARATDPYVGVFKVGLTTFTALGPLVVQNLSAG